MTLCLWFVLALNTAAQDAPAGFIFPAINPESATYANNDLYYADTSGRVVNLTDSVAESENAAVWLPGGEAILFSRNRPVDETPDGYITSTTDFWRMPIAADGTPGEAVLLLDLMDEVGPIRADRWLLSPDADTLYIQRNSNGDLYRFDLNTGIFEYLTTPDDHESPYIIGLEDDGALLVYAYAICPEQGECGTGYAAIELDSGRVISPFEWDELVIFHAEASGVTARYTEESTGFTLIWDNQTTLVEGGVTPSLSPDGTQVVYGVWDDENEGGGIWLLERSSPNDPRLLIPARTSVPYYPSWSPDGGWLAFFGQSGSTFTLNVRDNDTGMVQTVHRGGFFGSLEPVQWRPAPG
jgi:Tol biopolymer transport system component